MSVEDASNLEGLPEHVNEVITSITSGIQERMSPLHATYFKRYVQAEAAVREEHPELFIEYNNPRNAKGKLKRRSRQAKINSRAKKRRYAVEAKLAELGGNPLVDPAALLEVAIETFVVEGYATPEQEVKYLEEGFREE